MFIKNYEGQTIGTVYCEIYKKLTSTVAKKLNFPAMCPKNEWATNYRANIIVDGSCV